MLCVGAYFMLTMSVQMCPGGGTVHKRGHPSDPSDYDYDEEDVGGKKCVISSHIIESLDGVQVLAKRRGC